MLLRLKVAIAFSLLIGSSSSWGADSAESTRAADRSPSFLELRLDNLPSSLATITAEVRGAIRAAQTHGGGTSAEKDSTEKPALQRALTKVQGALENADRGVVDDLYYLEGVVNEARSDFASALKSYDRSLSVRAGSPSVLFRSAVALKELNRCPEALERLKELQWLTDQARHEVLYLQAECLIALNRSGEGFAALQEAQRTNPNFAPVNKLLTTARVQSALNAGDKLNRNEADQVANILEQQIRQNPKDRDATLMLAKLLVKRGDPLFSVGPLTRGEKLALTLAERSKYKDEEAVRLAYEAQLKRGDRTAAAESVRLGLRANPGAKSLQEAKQQLDLLDSVGANTGR